MAQNRTVENDASVILSAADLTLWRAQGLNFAGGLPAHQRLTIDSTEDTPLQAHPRDRQPVQVSSDQTDAEVR